MKNAHMSAEDAMKNIGINPHDFQKYADMLLNIN